MIARITRHAIVLAILFTSACALDAADDYAADDVAASLEATTRIRVMAANISSGNYQSYDPGHGIRIFQGTDPDIVMIQEFNYGNNTASDIRSFVDTAFGPTFDYYREAGAQIPNGVISRYPIIESGEWTDPNVSNRDFAYARIDIPGTPDLWAVSVHFLTSSTGARSSQASDLVAYIKQQVPTGDYLIIGGDFNTSSRTESCISTLRQVIIASSPYPADRNGNGNTNASRAKPYDWVLADGDLDPFETAVVIGGSVFQNGLVVDTRVYSPLAEISPALSGDSGSTNMQHMAVIRDFLVPGDGGGGGGGVDAGVPDAGVPVDSGGGGTASVFLNEILANEPGSSTSGEFVEVVNTGSGAADLSGWTLSDAVGTRHTFAAGTSLAAGTAVVVFGSASGIPFGTPGAIASSSGTLGLSNSGDTVTLRDDSSATVDAFSYSSSLSGTDGVSMNRSPDVSDTGSFVLHTSLSASKSSPGTRVNGASF